MISNQNMKKSIRFQTGVLLLTVIHYSACFIMDLPPHYDVKNGKEFDYVVVGAGAAGCAAAARLALAGRDVLLIEAGGDPDIMTTIPVAAQLHLGSHLDWQYQTISNNISCLSSEGEQCRFSRGKCLGGSSSINYMLYTRGNHQDYNYDIPGWSYNDLSPYFLRYEGLQTLDKLPPSSIPYHNTSGIMKLEMFPDSGNPWQGRLFEGFGSIGFPSNPDVNAQSQIGISRGVGFVYGGQRMSAARAYLTNSLVKKNLKVTKHTMCIGVIITDDNVAVGVRVKSKESTIEIFAKREIILCAGTIGTPQILMLSGIGPSQHLKKLNIKMHADIPVGENLRDHMTVFSIITVNQDLINMGVHVLKAITDIIPYATTRAGSLGSNGITGQFVYFNSFCYDAEARKLLDNCTSCESPTNEFEMSYVEREGIVLGKEIFKQSTNLKDDIIQQIVEANTKKALLVMVPTLLQPASVGWIRLASADPLAPPHIYPNYLSDPEGLDLAEIVRALKVIEDLAQTPIFKKYGAEIMKIKLDDCCETDYWPCYIRHMTYSVFHATGTAQLGPVLDECMRVLGVKRLRVADLSALPHPPRGNTAAVAIALGERVAEFILQDEK